MEEKENNDTFQVQASEPASRPTFVVRRRAPLPWVTLFLVVLYVAIEVTLQILDGMGVRASGVSAREWAFERFGQHRPSIWAGEYHRLITCTLLHGGAWHLAVNSLATFLLGRIVERWFGHARFLLFHVLFAFGGSLAYQAAPEIGIGVGASGAVCGLVGVFLVGRAGTPRDGSIVLGRRFARWISIAVILLLVDSVIVEFLMPGVKVADMAHFGGLAAGILGGCYVFSARTPLGLRRKVRVGFTTCVVLFAFGAYGLGFPVFDWHWYAWRIEKIQYLADQGEAELDPDLIASLEEQARYFGGDAAGLQVILLRIDGKRLDDALSYWHRRSLESPIFQLIGGDEIYDAFYAQGRVDELDAVLDDQIALGDRVLIDDPDDVMVLNNVAWYRALRGRELDKALKQAQRATELLPDDPGLLNTLGWVHFKRGESRLAFKYLHEAVRAPAKTEDGWGLFSETNPGASMNRYGANYLYLGLAYRDTGRIPEARDAALRARVMGNLRDHEEKMLSELEESLASGPLPGEAPKPRSLERRSPDSPSSEG